MGNNINVILGSKGKCCLCSNTPHCGDCDEEEPPGPDPICDCNDCGYFNVPDACLEKAEELYGACGICENKGPCESVCGSGKGTQGCYRPVQIDCDYLGCWECENIPVPIDPCEKIVDDADGCSCEDMGLFCCSYADKTCTDFNFNYFSDPLSSEFLCGGDDCYKEVEVECETLTCYECKTCDDFGYSDDPELECEAGEIKTPVNPCGEILSCYYCAPDNCDCSDYGYFDTCEEARDSLFGCGECETQTPFPEGSDCEFKVCYRAYCTQCGDIGEATCAKLEPECPSPGCYKLNVIEDWVDCDPPCNNTPSCCTCDLLPCSEFAPCDDITYVENPNDCPIPLIGKFASTPCDSELKKAGIECHRCCEDACPISGNYCGLLTAPCGAQQPAGSSSIKFYSFNGPQCEAVTIKINYSMGFTPDVCTFECLVACGGLQNIGTTGCVSGTGSTNVTVPKDAISIASTCTYNCSSLGQPPFSSSIDGFSISCVP